MDLEQAIRTQRDALLRLLAGWLAVVVLLSVAPVSPAWTRRVRAFVASVLWRAEAAAHCLVVVYARRLAADQAGLLALRGDTLFARAVESDEPPSLAELRARLLALRCLLNALPRRARQLVRRLGAVSGSDAAPVTLPGQSRATRRSKRLRVVSQCWPPTLWHPPKASNVSPTFASPLPPVSGAEA